MKKNILFINNTKIFFSNFGGYSKQLHYLCSEASRRELSVFYFISCFDLKNNQPWTTPYTYDKLKSNLRKHPYPSFLQNDYLQKITFFSNQDMKAEISIDRINHIIQEHDIHLVFFLGDVFVFSNNPPQQKFHCPSISWFPCHYFPMTIHDHRGLSHFDTIWSLSPSITIHLQDLFPDKCIDYVPHMIKPISTECSKKDLRSKYQIPQGSFVFFINASLYEFSNRKAIDIQIIAFSKLLKKYPSCFLLIHSASIFRVSPFVSSVVTPQTIDIHAICQACKIPSTQYRWNQDILQEKELYEFYGLSDCLLLCSKSEGFGVPLLEAQLCELFVISSDFLSMKEHNFQQFIAQSSTESYNFPQQGQWTDPSSHNITKQMEMIVEERDSIHFYKRKKMARWIVSSLTNPDKIVSKLFKKEAIS